MKIDNSVKEFHSEFIQTGMGILGILLFVLLMFALHYNSGRIAADFLKRHPALTATAQSTSLTHSVLELEVR